MLQAFLGWLLKLLTGPAVDKVLGYLEGKANSQTERERIRTQVTIAEINAAVSETRVMADLQASKMGHWPYWAFVALFILPLGIWWAAVLLDTTFRFGWGVANLPQTYIREWAGEMIRWLFYTGSGAMALRWATGR